MALTFYGASTADIITVTAADPTTADPNHKDLSPVTSGTLTAWTAMSGGTQITDLFAADPTTGAAGAAITVVTPTSLGRIMFWANNYSAAIWLQDSSGNRWRIYPGDLDSRVGGVSSVSVNGGTAQTGAVSITVPTADLSAYPTTSTVASMIADALAGYTPSLALSDLTDVDLAGAGPGLYLSQDTDGISRMSVPPEAPNTLHGLFKVAGAADPVGAQPGDLILSTGTAGGGGGGGATFGVARVIPGGGGPNSNTATLTLGQPLSVGELIVIAVGADATGSIAATFSATDNGTTPNTYTPIASSNAIQGSSNQGGLLVCYVTQALASGKTITITSTGTRQQITASAVVITGAATSAAVDKVVTAAAPNVTSLVVGPTPTLTQTDEVVVAAYYFTGYGHAFTPPAGFTSGGRVDSNTTTAQRSLVICYKTVSSTSAVTAAAQLDTSSNYAASLATIKKAA